MSEHEIICPHTDCHEDLHLMWDLAYTLSPPDLDGSGLTADGAHTQWWKVECSAGHVVLLPSQSLGCPCPFDEQESDTCPHDPDDWDQSEEWRQFRPYDAQRLRDVLDAQRVIDDLQAALTDVTRRYLEAEAKVH